MKPTRYFSNKQETKVAKQLGGRKQSNSGATAFAKGDVVAPDTLIECKTLTKKQKTRTIEKEWYTKLNEEKLAMGKRLGLVVFDFGDGDNIVSMTMSDFINLYEAWKEINEND